MPEAKAVFWSLTDVEERKHREQTGFETLVVYAVKDGNYQLRKFLVIKLTR